MTKKDDIPFYKIQASLPVNLKFKKKKKKKIEIFEIMIHWFKVICFGRAMLESY